MLLAFRPPHWHSGLPIDIPAPLLSFPQSLAGIQGKGQAPPACLHTVRAFLDFRGLPSVIPAGCPLSFPQFLAGIQWKGQDGRPPSPLPSPARGEGDGERGREKGQQGEGKLQTDCFFNVLPKLVLFLVHPGFQAREEVG